MAHTAFRGLLAAAAVLGLAACGEQAPTEYEADATDQSGELIVEDADAEGVDVTLPDTPMTNVPPEGAASEAPGEAPAEEAPAQ